MVSHPFDTWSPVLLAGVPGRSTSPSWPDEAGVERVTRA